MNRMNRKKYVILAALLVILFASIYIIQYRSIDNRISKDLGIYVPKSLNITYSDSHSWFLGDGITQAKATLNDEQIDNIITKSNAKWSKTPIPNNIASTIYNKGFDDNSNNVEPEIGISETKIANGYWIFKNRASKDTSNSFSNTKLSNYSIGIIDIDKNVLYYIKFDS